MSAGARGVLAVVLTVLAATGLAGSGAAARVAARPLPPLIVTGQDAGWPDVRQWTAPGVQQRGDGSIPAFAPYPTYQGGVRVAVGDVNGDGRLDVVTSSGRDAWTTVKAFDGRTLDELRSGGAFGQFGDWWGGAFVAAADTNGDGKAEIVEGLEAGCCTTVSVLDGTADRQLSSFPPFGNGDPSGARVAAGDVSGDRQAEIFAVQLQGTRVGVFGPSGGSELRSYAPFAPYEALAGAAIAAGNLAGDARVELVAAAPTAAGTAVKVLDTRSGAVLSTIFPFGGQSVAKLAVATGDVDGDGFADVVVVGQAPDGMHVKALDLSGRELASFYVVDPAITPGASVAAGDLDGDGKAEIVLGSGPTTTPWPPSANGADQRVAIFERDGTKAATFSAYTGVFQGGARVAEGDVTGDAVPEIVTAPGPGMQAEVSVFAHDWHQNADRGNRLQHFLAFEPEFTGGASVAVGDVDGDGTAELVVGAGAGRAADVRVFSGGGKLLASWRAFDAPYTGGISVAAGDLNGDGRAEIVAGTLQAPARVRAFSESGAPFGAAVQPFAADVGGVEVGVADLEGDGRAEVLAAPPPGAAPEVGVVDPVSGVVRRFTAGDPGWRGGLHVAGGDLDRDGRDEVVVAQRFGGDGRVLVFDHTLRATESFPAYDWTGPGVYLAVNARIGFPLAATSRTVTMAARVRQRVVVATFRDASGNAPATAYRAVVSWGDGTSWRALVLSRGAGILDVRSTKRYARPGRYAVTVVLSTGARTSVAHSTAVVRRR